MAHPLRAARTLANLSDWTLSNLSLNKILYCAHMVHLGRSNGVKRLIPGGFEAWDYGPVSPEVYHHAKIYGAKAVQDVFHRYPLIENGEELDVIREAYDSLGDKDPGELIAITHWEEGAWASRYVPGMYGIKIPDEAVFEEYKKRVG